MSEHSTQVAIFKWAKLQSGAMPELSLMFAIPNAGRRGVIHGRNMKEEGMKAGVPDIMLPVPRAHYHGLFIELKVGNNDLSAVQEQWLLALSSQGYMADVCYGFDAAINMLTNYLKLDKPD